MAYRSFRRTLLPVLTMLIGCAMVPAYAAKTPAQFAQHPTLPQRYTKVEAVTMEMSAPESAASVKYRIETHNVLTAQEQGGYLLDITIKSAEITGEGYAPTSYATQDLNGLHYQLDMDEAGEMKGYHGDNTPEAWLQQHLAPEKFQAMRQHEEEWKFLQKLCTDSLAHLLLRGRPANVGARWFAVDGASASANGSSLRLLVANTVTKREKAGGRNGVRVEAAINSNLAALAATAKCTVAEITSALPDAAAAAEAETDPDAPTLTGTGKDFFIIDPATLRCYTYDAQRTIRISFRMDMGCTGEEKTEEPAMVMQISVHQLLTYQYE